MGPRFFAADFGIRRNFPIKETIKLQLRWGFFNAFNHVNLYLAGAGQTISGSAGECGGRRRDVGRTAQSNVLAAGSASAGMLLGSFQQRIEQLALRLAF
jgi:hypothetical protein